MTIDIIHTHAHTHHIIISNNINSIDYGLIVKFSKRIVN